MKIDQRIKEDYLSYDWGRLKKYDEAMRAALTEDHRDHDTWGSDDERTFHLLRLTRSARASGDRKFVDLLLEWYGDPRFSECPRLQMTILVSLVRATFYRTALHLLERILTSPRREWVIRGMCDSQVMFLSYGMAAPFFPDSVSCRFRELFSGDKPWVSSDQLYQEVREGFMSQIRAYRESNEGGWEVDGGTPSAPPEQGIFFAGQFFDSLRPIEAIIRTAIREIVLIDGYVSTDTLALLSGKADGVVVCVLTKSTTPALSTAALAFNKQYGGLSLRASQAFHDRFLIIDGTDYYHIGASIKDFAKRAFMYSRIDDAGVRTALWEQWSTEWSTASAVV